jgi:Transposase DDE domain
MSRDGRDWHSYNEALVRRGELELDSSVIEEWNKELKKENDGKVGEPYRYPESYIRLLAFVRLLFHMPYRETEGFVHFLSKHVEGLKVPDYSTMDRRMNKLDVRLDETIIKSNSPVTIAVDSSGIKVHNGGDWIRHVWKVKRGYLKVHFAVDIRTKQVVSMDVSSEKVADGKRLKRLVDRAEESVRVERVLGDGAYDSRANFNFLDSRHIKPVIRIRKGSVPKSRGSQARKLAVIEQQAFKPRSWSRIHRFGYRWRVEGAYSCIKRIFGEYVSAKKFVNMAREMAMKAAIYNRFIVMV